MNFLFEPVKIGNVEIKNRLVRSATFEGCADRKGHVSDIHIDIIEKLANGGVGLIITGIVYVHPSGQISPFQSSIYRDGHIPGLKRLTSAAHDNGAKIAIQLHHGGREAARFLKTKNELAFAPSSIGNDPYFQQPSRTMGDEDIREIIRSFGDAARRAMEAGFDAVQLHGAHGYLISQFLSPYTNRRTDDWGGSLEKRLHFLRSVYEDIRSKVGENYPVFIKIGIEDGVPGGLEFEEGKLAAQAVAGWPFDALEISQGLRGLVYDKTEFRTRINHIDREAYFRDWCREVKRLVHVPTMMVGGLRSIELMEEIVQNGEADFISLSRPLIREPGIVNDWKQGDRRRAACISCNKCLEALRKGQALHCVPLKHKARRN